MRYIPSLCYSDQEIPSHNIQTFFGPATETKSYSAHSEAEYNVAREARNKLQGVSPFPFTIPKKCFSPLERVGSPPILCRESWTFCTPARKLQSKTNTASGEDPQSKIVVKDHHPPGGDLAETKMMVED